MIKLRKTLSNWPLVGIGVGIALNTAGLATDSATLIATGSNVLTISGLFLVQKTKNKKTEK
jgi:hypothetical protein